MKGVETGKKELYGRIRWPMCDMCTHNTHIHNKTSSSSEHQKEGIKIKES